ncbi:phage antirepressor N-terminal domain-containing protein [Pseudomonas sichuanensis]|uniref:phage antirepressor N-terminal domain-containing protein n=1 Tax=Pseudomonas sichuanensis TaxID=2213015 RepID=UPI00244A9E89|nr:phage antirepressor N-terminal domain-containing protein [Pseudomonas sichuanensis]MDH0730963.1 phage antirepressor N-terminal domain-containing protein [Pseudomonas sichuanensis]MDH1581060.1 phage antirepressor N-terminal domain-containing protein [Pseudomonas sichuanensis]MDH1591079.1 phage antirepressor N-terminal domain-containing protein [Pseudomonas sichuanensis]MDH1596748.1 phage antirepressor N-terminal domain-containing protein [Pseudomonas sichuanensis]
MSKNSGHEKALSVAALRASVNEINFGEEIVMGDSSTAVSSVIPFRSAKLLLVEYEGQPFAPMKPVVEGMGLDWKTQYRKLQGGRFNSVMVMMTATGADGKQYEMACLPLRKLAGWLMSIHASKVRPELRDGVIAYQNECDDALWSYWNEGRAVNHRELSQSMTVFGQTIGTDGFHMLGAIVKGKVSSLPAPIQRRATAKIWSQTHAAFGVRSAADSPADQLDAARNFIAAYAVEGEWLPKEERKLGTFVLDEFQAQNLNNLLHYTDWVNYRWKQGIGDAVKLLNPKFHACTWEFFHDAHRNAQRLERSLPELIAFFKDQGRSGLRPHECIAMGRSVKHPAD